MKNIPFLFVGILFGIILTKSEVISWFRIYEMFRFESFHMYGIIGTAVVLGVIMFQLMKRFGFKTIGGGNIPFQTIPFNFRRHLIAGTVFGLGWALVGSCPGPIFSLIGNGYSILLVVLLGAIIGTYSYGFIRKHLPH